MRTDVRALTRQAAEQELRHNRTYILLVSEDFVSANPGWSRPVQMRFEPSPDVKGIVEAIFREVGPGDSA